jgi:hypothetical protein
MVLGVGFFDPTTVDADTKVVPSVTVAERYDSNVFYAPQSFVPIQRLWDFVTVVAPEVKVQQSGTAIEGDLRVGGSANTYVNNPGLNYFSANAAFHLNLDNWISQLMERTGLQVDEYFQYTPEQPSFLTPKAEITSAPLLLGIQAFRANSLFNVARATGTYDISPTLSVQGTYLNSITSFGRAFVAAGPGAFFSTTTQTASAGPQIKLSPRDTASLSYAYSTTAFGDAFGFATHNISAEYTRYLTPALLATMNAGGTQIEPGGTKHVVGKASFDWRLSENERWTITYTRSVTANIFLAASPVVSQRVSAGIVHQFTQRLTMTASANYASNKSTSAPVVRFTSYGTGLGLTYLMTRFISASLQHEYYNFNYTGIPEFDRNAVTFSISATWP